MASSISFTRWAVAAVVTAVLLSGLVIVTPLGSLIGVRLAPGLPFRILRVGENNSRILYPDEFFDVEWDLSPENQRLYPGETFALCPSTIRRLHRSCTLIANYVPNTGFVRLFLPPHIQLGQWNLVIQAWRTNDTFVATSVGTAIPVAVRSRSGEPPAFSPSPSIPISDPCGPGGLWCPSVLPPRPSPVLSPSPSVPPAPSPVASPLPPPSPSPAPTPSRSPSPSPSVIPAQVSFLEPTPGTVRPAGNTSLSIRLQRFLGSASGLACEHIRLQRPDGTIVPLTSADWLQALPTVAPPC